MDKREYAEDAIGVVLEMYNVSESVPITPVLDEVEKIIDAAQHRVRLTAFGLLPVVFFFGFGIGAIIFNGLCGGR